MSSRRDCSGSYPLAPSVRCEGRSPCLLGELRAGYRFRILARLSNDCEPQLGQMWIVSEIASQSMQITALPSFTIPRSYTACISRVKPGILLEISDVNIVFSLIPLIPLDYRQTQHHRSGPSLNEAVAFKGNGYPVSAVRQRLGAQHRAPNGHTRAERLRAH